MSRPVTDLLADSIAEWDLRQPEQVAVTPRAVVYRASLSDGRSAALKLALPIVGDDESRAPGWLRWHDGDGAVKVHNWAPDRLLMEWFDGPLLANLCDTGRDDEATHAIADCVTRLNARNAPYTADLMPFDQHAGALLNLDLGALPPMHRDAMGEAKAMCKILMESAPDRRPLHGDLHHENIGLSERGWLAFDPKGVLGDPHYELANSMRNPFGRVALTHDPDRPARMARIYAVRLGLDQIRMLNWAFVLTAMSVSWELPRGTLPESDYALVHRFREIAKRAS